MTVANSKEMRLLIIDCKPVYHGINKKGDEYDIYEVRASKPETPGQPINEKLRTFTALPAGQVVEVTVTPFNSVEHGKSFTLYPKGNSGSSVNQQNENRSELVILRENMAKLAARVSTLENYIRKNMIDQKNQTSQPASDVAALDAAFGADPAF